MAIENLLSVTLTQEELTQLDENIKAINDVLSGKCISLTPDERQSYARLGDGNTNWSRKVIKYMGDQPEFTPSFVDPGETMADFETREALIPRFRKLEAIMDMLDDTMLVLGSDVYESNLAYYQNIKLLANQNVNGTKAIYEDLASQFPGGRPRKANTSDEL